MAGPGRARSDAHIFVDIGQIKHAQVLAINHLSEIEQYQMLMIDNLGSVRHVVVEYDHDQMLQFAHIQV